MEIEDDAPAITEVARYGFDIARLLTGKRWTSEGDNLPLSPHW